MDARHPFSPLDEQLIDWLGDIAFFVLLTKADKLSRSAQATLLADTARRVGRDRATLFSSITRQGVDECRDRVEQWLDAAAVPHCESASLWRVDRACLAADVDNFFRAVHHDAADH